MSRRTFQPSRLGRLAAGAIALTGLVGLAVQFAASLDRTGSAGAALWAMLRYFTIIGNLLAVLVMGGIALGLRAAARPAVIGGIALLMLLICMVHATLLRDLLTLSGGAHLAEFLQHRVMPLLVAAHWLLFARKGGVRAHDVLRWAAIPLAYAVYALGRAALDGRYPYPFMDVALLGWGRVMLNLAAIALGFLLSGAILFWIDQILGRGRR